MANAKRGAWAAVELDSGELARVPGANDEGAAERVRDTTRPVALFDSERAAQRFLLAVFGPEAGKEWSPRHLNQTEAAAAFALVDRNAWAATGRRWDKA